MRSSNLTNHFSRTEEDVHCELFIMLKNKLFFDEINCTMPLCRIPDSLHRLDRRYAQ